MHQAVTSTTQDAAAIAALAARLDSAALAARATAQLTADHPGLTLADAYRIQRALIERRVARGEQVVGVKMGFTSRAKMAQMGVSDLIWGELTDAMEIADGGELDFARFIHPRIEPEIAFRLKTRLTGAIDTAAAAAAIEAIAPAMEVIDSRYADFRFDLVDVVADNSSSAAFVIGAWTAPMSDYAHFDMTMCFDGAAVQRGSTAAILGDPLMSLVEAVRLVGQSGRALEAGTIVLCGAATSAEPLRSRVAVSLDAGALGTARLRVVGGGS